MRQRGGGWRERTTQRSGRFTITPFWDCDVGRLRRRRGTPALPCPALASCYENHKGALATPHECMIMSGQPTDLVVHSSQLCAFARSQFLVFFLSFFEPSRFFVFVLGDHMPRTVQVCDRRRKKNQEERNLPLFFNLH
jgi:hypothetical protein